MFIAETGTEDIRRAPWLRYVAGEVRAAIDAGVPLHGICLYPIVNHPGWVNQRHCHNGLWDYADVYGHRPIYKPLQRELDRARALFETPDSAELVSSPSLTLPAPGEAALQPS
jgi:hypothetical protein